MTEQAEGPDQELLRARDHVLAVRAEHGADAPLDRREVRARGPSSPRRTSGRSRPATPSARRPRSSTRTTGSSRPSCRPGTYRNITGNEATALGFLTASQAGRPPAVLRQLPDHPGQRHPPPALDLQDVRRQDVPGRGRDRRHRRGDRRAATAGRSGMTASSGPGHRAQDRGDGPRRHGRAAARRHRRPARRPVDRHAHQERAGRPAPGHVRPQLRLADPDRRAGDARRVLRPGHRGVAASRSST